MKKTAAKKTKKAAPGKPRRAAQAATRRLTNKGTAKTPEDKRYVVVRTPYPTLEETAATLGVPLTRANRIRDLVRQELIRRDPETGALTILAPKANGALVAELTSRRGTPGSGGR